MIGKTAAQIFDDLQKKKYSALELTTHILGKIKKYNSTLNAFITITEEQALEQAKYADNCISKDKDPSLLLGVPIAHKDIFCTKNIKTTCGSKMLSNFIAPYDATVVEKLSAAKTIHVGKTNMDEFAMGSSNESSYYGPVKNPWDLSCVPGGSSGGSAAIVASGLIPIATGTDTGGSIRQPAALCGISGIKPTYGRVSRFGMIAFASSLDQGGVLAKTAYDLALAMNYIASYDPKDSTSINIETPNYLASLTQPINGIKIGIPKEFMQSDLDPKIAQTIIEFTENLEKLGAKVIEIELPHINLSIPAYYVIAPAECSANLARYDGIRYGYHCNNPLNINELYEKTRAEGFGKEVKRRIFIGTYTLSAAYYDAYYLKAQKVRRLIQNDFLTAFKKVDAIIGPTSPVTAFKLGEKTTDPIQMYLSDIFTIGANLAGLPALSIPIGFIDEKPVGGQIIGNYFKEAQLLNIAHIYQTSTDWHTKKSKLEITIVNDNERG